MSDTREVRLDSHLSIFRFFFFISFDSLSNPYLLSLSRFLRPPSRFSLARTYRPLFFAIACISCTSRESPILDSLCLSNRCATQLSFHISTAYSFYQSRGIAKKYETANRTFDSYHNNGSHTILDHKYVNGARVNGELKPIINNFYDPSKKTTTKQQNLLPMKREEKE